MVASAGLTMWFIILFSPLLFCTLLGMNNYITRFFKASGVKFRFARYSQSAAGTSGGCLVGGWVLGPKAWGLW